MIEITPEHIINILAEGDLPCAPVVAQLVAMCHDHEIKISDGRARREELLGTYTIRLEHGHGTQEELSVVVSSLAKYQGDWVRIIAISTPTASGGLLMADDGTPLAALARSIVER
ncbi:hypothetical protein ACNOYE_14240 [Nannocystaceae bacterium ST9]